MQRIRRGAAVVFGVTVLQAVGLAQMAAAQYPPGPTTTASTTPATTTTTATGATTTTIVSTGGTQVAGQVSVGGSFTREACGFAPGSTVMTSLNGGGSVTQTADANGCLQLTVAVLSETQVRVAGATLPARCGPNTLVATGTGAAGQQGTQTVTFTVVCPASAGGRGAFTRANVGRWAGLGAALVGVGVLIVLAARRRGAPTG